jgi:hypothetical protein
LLSGILIGASMTCEQGVAMSTAGRSDTEVLIAGGGPAGMMAGLLFARAGVKTLGHTPGTYTVSVG